MPVKDGDIVYYKIKNGQVRSGKYDAKTKAVTNKNGQKAFPPKKALHHTIQGAKDAPFTPHKSSTAILGAPKRYSGKKETPKPATPKKTPMDKKAQEGKLTQKAFLEDVESQDGYEKARDKHYEKLMDDILYIMSSQEDTSEMTEKQQNKFMNRADRRAYRDQQTFLKELFTKLIKGKKFKSFKEASKVFITNIK